MILAFALIMALQVGGGADAPMLRTDPSGDLVIDSPGDNPSQIYRVTLDGRRLEGRSIEEYLGRVLNLEGFDIVSYRPEDGEAEIRTTEWGGFALTRELRRDAGEVLTSLHPEVSSIAEDRCVSLLAILPAEPGTSPAGEIFGPTLCPPSRRVTPGENLIVVGLDSQGRSIWTAMGDNSRFYRLEDLGRAEGPVRQTGEHPDSPYVSTLIVPTIEGLVRLRWFAVGAEGALEQIGEGDWRAERR